MLNDKDVLFVLRLFLTLIFFLPPALWAELSSVTSPDGFNSSIALEQVRNKMRGLEEVQGLDEAQKKKLLDLYQLTKERLQTAQGYRDKARVYRQAIEAAPAKIEEINRHLASPGIDKAMAALEQIPGETPLSELEQRLAAEQAGLATLESSLAGLEKQWQEQQSRPRQARDQLTEAKQQQERIENDLKALPPEETSLISEARQLALQARLEVYLNEINMLDQELSSHNVRLQLLKAQRDLTAQQVWQTQARVKFLEALIRQRRREEVGQAQEAAARAEWEAAGKHPAIQDLAAQNARLSKEFATLATRLSRVTAEREAAEAHLKQMEQDFKNARQSLEIAGLNKALQQFLQDQRRSLPDLSHYQEETEQHRVEMAEVGLSQLRVDGQRHQLNKLEDAVTQVIAEQVGPGLAPSPREEIKVEVRHLLKGRQALLDKLSAIQSQYLRSVGNLEFIQQQLMERAKQYAVFLDEHLLWIPSAAPLDFQTGQDLLAGIVWLLSLEGWQDTARALGSIAMEEPLLIIVVILIFIGLLQVRYNLGGTLKTTTERITMPYADRFSFTLRAFIVTLLAAAPWPLLVGFIGWLLRVSPEVPGFAKAVGAGLTAISLPLFLMHGFRLLCRSHGVAIDHFGWQQQTVTLWRKNLTWVIPVMLPALFVATVAGAEANEIYAESLGRVGLLVSMVALAVFFQRILRPKGGIAERYLDEQPRSWLSRFRYVWYPAIVFLPISLAGLAVIGYFYTALHLKNEIVVTLYLIIAAALVHDLAIRWLEVTQRKLALLKMRERREIERVTQATREAAGRSGAGIPTKLDIYQVDIQTVDSQTRQLLRTVVGLSIIVGFWLIWAPTFPALGILNDITLWHHTAVVEGQEVQKPFTLANLALALVLALAAFGAARNLPGVLEIVVLRRLSLVPGSRYAITTLLRYAIGSAGIVLVFDAIGGSWSQIQWLVAALTVGLGFGLQEIFANFVSGLIILFERPIRVGDVVTVGDISGTVSRIRIRATTVTDFDRKELIVPNKSFVTDRLVNWTLSDPITRITLKMGVAYGSDTTLTHQIILGVVNANPLVLEDPPPSVYFVGFGEGTLDFIVWAFVRELGNRYPLMHELNTAINRALGEQGIEIPFPQRDIHVRSVNMPALNGLGSQRAPEADCPPSQQEDSVT
ncbi:mechanosensitive ion channel domain-containing protein [Nitrosococcus oceani]|uniref:mechanosensitive ion channel domain-containing protein n=1 Tax=Nitrosococcus oceani TaxID=1229 RepID=UPI0004E915C8|nr:mechanosensitive ion channel domain-containing protein [Nitrosococcus oceani]KFI22193.1 mechanosensitive ion channel protein MscS [Nitrosococcus oceani]